MYQNQPESNAAARMFPSFGGGRRLPPVKYPNRARFRKNFE